MNETEAAVYGIEDGFMHTEEAAESLETGQRVRLRFIPSDGSADERPREENEPEDKIGTVHKTHPDHGAVWVRFDVGNGMVWKLHPVPGGTITGTNPYGSRSVRKGVNARIQPFEEGDPHA